MIDFYAFYGPWPYWDSPHTEPRSMLRLMSENHIDRAVVCHTGAIFDDWISANDALLQAAEHEARFIPFVCLNPDVSTEKMIAAMNSYNERGAMGIRLYPQHHNYSLRRPAAGVMLEHAAQLDLPIVLSVRIIMQWGLPLLSKEDIETTILGNPAVRFIISGTNYSETRWLFDMMHVAPNVSAEISGMEGFRAVQEAIGEVGAGRLLFGAGTPLQYPACSVAKLQVTHMSPAEEDAIRNGNALKVLGFTG